MRPTNRFTYAIKALVDLALRQGAGPVTVATIAKRQKIPVRSLEQLFNRLRRKGLVRAERGPRGGYRLTLPADEIPVRTIFEALEPQALSPRGVAFGGSEGVIDPAKAVWQQVQQAVHATLEATTLGALAAQIRETSASAFEHSYTFHI